MPPSATTGGFRATAYSCSGTRVQPSGLLGPIVCADLVGLSEQDATARLLSTFGGRTKPHSVAFPGSEATEGARLRRGPIPRRLIAYE